MIRRPVCLACLILAAAVFLADGLGFPLIRGNPLPASVQNWIKTHPDAQICGEAVRCAKTEFSQSIYLNHTYLIYQSEKVSIENVRVFLKEEREIPVGTILLVSGKLEAIEGPRNPGEFDSRQYYGADRIYYFLKDGEIQSCSKDYRVLGEFLARLRAKFQSILSQSAAEAAPVMEAMVLGEKSNLEEELKIRYQMAGIVHILVISGLHISLLGMGVYKIFMKSGMGIWAAGILSLTLMLGYGMMTGGSVSTMRAVCMFLLSVGAKLLGRCYDMLTSLALAAILAILDSPANLYNCSFLLSFGAVLALGIVSPVLIKAAGAKKSTAQAFWSSLSVQIFTLPVVLWFYGEVSVLGIFLNLLVLPTVGIALASGAACALLGIFQGELALLAAVPGRVVLFAYEKLCELSGRLPFCTWIGGRPQLWQILVYYFLGGAALVLLYNLSEKQTEEEKKGKRRMIKMAGAGLMGGGLLLLSWHPLKDLRITCMDVGQGDGIFVETPEGFCFLIDGGSSNKSDVGQYQLLPCLKSRGIPKVDGILISHPDEDHISGVCQMLEYIRDGLTVIRVETLFLPFCTDKTQGYQELEKLALEAGAEVAYVKKGDCLEAGELSLSFLAPFVEQAEDTNENSTVIQLAYGSFRGLFTGDIGEEREKQLLPALSQVDFLKVAHHGSRYSTSEAFLEKTKPRIGVISCSDTNTYGHPSPDTVKRLTDAGCQVEYTMKSGAVILETDGVQIKVKRFAAE